MSAAELAVFDILMRSLVRINSSLAFCLRKYKSSPFEDYIDLSSLQLKKLANTYFYDGRYASEEYRDISL